MLLNNEVYIEYCYFELNEQKNLKGYEKKRKNNKQMVILFSLDEYKRLCLHIQDMIYAYTSHRYRTFNLSGEIIIASNPDNNKNGDNTHTHTKRTHANKLRFFTIYEIFVVVLNESETIGCYSNLNKKMPMIQCIT